MCSIDLDAFAREMDNISGGRLYCLPYTVALLEYLRIRGISARPLVARAVVFAVPSGCTWDDLLSLAGPGDLFRAAVDNPAANGELMTSLPATDSQPAREVRIPYRTLGYTHGAAPLGDYASDGSWSGHIVVISDGTMIDMTIGQLNSPRFNIQFSSPRLISETTPDFVNGQSLLAVMRDGLLICYQAFPEETTHEQSRSWSDESFHNELMEVARRAATIASNNSDEDAQPSA